MHFKLKLYSRFIELYNPKWRVSYFFVDYKRLQWVNMIIMHSWKTSWNVEGYPGKHTSTTHSHVHLKMIVKFVGTRLRGSLMIGKMIEKFPLTFQFLFVFLLLFPFVLFYNVHVVGWWSHWWESCLQEKRRERAWGTLLLITNT